MGLGPAVFGVLFYLFHVDLGSTPTSTVSLHINSTKIEHLLPPALQVSPHHRDTYIYVLDVVETRFYVVVPKKRCMH